MEEMMPIQQKLILKSSYYCSRTKSSNRTDTSAASACHQVTTVLLNLTVIQKLMLSQLKQKYPAVCASFNDDVKL